MRTVTKSLTPHSCTCNVEHLFWNLAPWLLLLKCSQWNVSTSNGNLYVGLF